MSIQKINERTPLAVCARFLVHARLVKTLEVEASDVHSSVYKLLSAAAMGRCLFTNIEALHWRSSKSNSPGLFFYLPLFLGPKIKTLHFEIGPTDNLSLSSFTHVMTRCPSLKCLNIEMDNTRVNIEVISSAVNGWRGLRELRVPSLSSAALAYIAALPGLQTLSLSSADGQGKLLNLSRAVAFSDLHVLSLEFTNLSFCTDILRTMSSHHLEEIDIHAARSTAFILEHFFDVLKRHCSRSSLRVIRVVDTDIETTHDEDISRYISSTDPKEYIVEEKVIRPLLQFPNLTELTLDPVGGFDLDDATRTWRWPGRTYSASHSG